MSSTAVVSSTQPQAPAGTRSRASGCPFVLSRAAIYGDAAPLPEPLVVAILEAWKNRTPA